MSMSSLAGAELCGSVSVFGAVVEAGLAPACCDWVCSSVVVRVVEVCSELYPCCRCSLLRRVSFADEGLDGVALADFTLMEWTMVSLALELKARHPRMCGGKTKPRVQQSLMWPRKPLERNGYAVSKLAVCM